MGILKGILYITIISILLFACTAKEKPDEESPSKIKSKFTTMIDEGLKLLQENENERKDNPECKPFELAFSKKDEHYYTNYWLFTGYDYNINKTDSIVSPYLADVQYKGISHVKKGKAFQDCLKTDWESDGKEVKLFLQQKYAYQDGTWVLKEQKGR